MKKILILASLVILAGCSSNVKVTKEFSYQASNPQNNSINRKLAKPSGSLTADEQNEIIMLSFSLLNTKYNWGGKRPDFGLDCSGLVSYVFKKSINRNITGAARHIVKHGKDVPLSHAKNGNLQPGDLVFFNTTGKSYSHVGIYVGENKFLHASSGKKKVILSSLDNKYYKQRLERIKRI